MNISSRDLEVFLALVDEKSFTRAAARCHLSQSAFSTRIGVIEEALGAKLFDRTTRSVELTPEGLLFEQSARRLFAEFSEIVDDFRDHAARRKGRVSIATLPSIAAGWMPRMFAQFRARYPGIDLSLTDTLSEGCLALVRNGQADFAIASGTAQTDDLDIHLVGRDRFYLVCRRDHPLLKRKRLRLADLAAYPFIQLASNSSVRQHLDAAFHPIQVRTALEVGYLATMVGMVEAGLGIAVVPALTLFQFRVPTLVVTPLTTPVISRPIYVVRRRGRSLSAAAQALYDQILADKLKTSIPLTTESDDMVAGLEP